MAVVNAIHPMDVQEPLPHTPMPPSMPSPPSITATTTATTVISNEIVVDDDDHSGADDDDDDGLLLKSQNSNGSSKTGSSSGSRTDSNDLVGSDDVDDNGNKDASSSQKQVGQETSASEPANSAVVELSSFHANNESFDIETNRLGDDGDCNQDKIMINFETNSELQNPNKDECHVPTPQISLDGELHRRRPSHHRRHSHASHLSRITPLLHHPDCNPALPTAPTTKLKSRPFNCLTWSSSRIRLAVLGCLASSLVLSVRLYFAYKPTAYLIHSIVVFADMVLIHLFTNCKWLSVSGEITTIFFAALYTVTKQTVFELMETTAIAVLCSFHMMGSRKRHREEEGRLLEDLTGLQVEVGEYLVLAQRDGRQLQQHQGNGVSPHHGNGSVAAGSRISQILLHTLSSMELDQEEWHSQHMIRLHEVDEIKRKELGDDEREYQRESKLAMELEQGEITTTTTTVPLTGAEHKIRLYDNDDHLVSSTCKYCGRRRSRPNLHVEFADMDVEISSFQHPSPSSNDPTVSPTCIVSTPSTNNANNHEGRRNISVIGMAGGADDVIDDNNYCDNSDDDDDSHHNNKNNKNNNNVHRLASKSDAATAPTAKTSRFALFFEHFLDGSAGVMYTSFLGLIIDELIHYESDDGKSAY